MSSSGRQYATATRAAPTLPNECYLIIAKHCTGATLQNFRLASKLFKSLADPVVWRHVRIVPNIDCLSRFAELLDDRPIASFVQTLVYDTNWQGIPDQLKAKYDKDGPSSNPATTSHRQTVDRCIQAQVRSIEGTLTETALLTRILLRIPRLQKLRCDERGVPFHDDNDPPPFLNKLCKDADVKPATLRMTAAYAPMQYISHLKSLLVAASAAKRSLESLELYHIAWHSLNQQLSSVADSSGRIPGTFQYRLEVFKNIKSLKLQFQNSPSPDLDSGLRALRQLLKACENLEMLRLRMADNVQTRYSTDYRMFSYLSALADTRSMKALMPKLRELNLQNCTCSQKDLLTFLMMHSSTLRVLTLANISLLRQEDNDMRGCWIHVIKAMRHALRLEKVTFDKWLCNGGRQRWYICNDKSAAESRIRPQIEDFVTKMTGSALPVTLEAMVVQAVQNDVPKPISGIEVEGDWTWAMTYSQGKYRYDRIDSTYSGDDFFSKLVPLINDTIKLPAESFLSWDNLAKPYSSYPKYGSHHKSYQKVKGKPTPPMYGWSQTPMLASGPGSSSKPPPPMPKMPSYAYAAPSPPLAYQPFGASKLASSDIWTFTAPAIQAASSTSSKSHSTASSSSQPSYIEDGFVADDASHQSPSQHSASQVLPPYTPSSPSYHSNISHDSLASWYQPSASYTSHDTYVSAKASQNKAKPYSHAPQSITWDDPWQDAFENPPPPAPAPPKHLTTTHHTPPAPAAFPTPEMILEGHSSPHWKKISKVENKPVPSDTPLSPGESPDWSWGFMTSPKPAASKKLPAPYSYPTPPATSDKNLPFGYVAPDDDSADDYVMAEKSKLVMQKKKATGKDAEIW